MALRGRGTPLWGWEDQRGHGDTLKEDWEAMGVEWSNARVTASDRVTWRQLVAQCSVWNGRN